MSTIAIIGAGPGLGAATARRFGREDFNVALVSRTQAHVDALAAELAAEGITARGYEADVLDRSALTSALASAQKDLGPIDVLQYSPIPMKRFLRHVLETTVDDVEVAAQFSILGLATAAAAVLPAMREIGAGTILLINGSTAAGPKVGYAGTSVAFAGESAYGRMLHDALTDEGVHVAQLVIPHGIGRGLPDHEPEALAETIWTIHQERGEYRTVVSGIGS